MNTVYVRVMADARTARTVLGVSRALVGLGAWFAPDVTVRLFGMDPARSDRFVGRLFGAREIALAGSLLATPGAALGPVASIGAAIDLADAVSGFDERRREPLAARHPARPVRRAGVRGARRVRGPRGGGPRGRVSAPPPYAHVLKRRPAQERSARRVEALLDAAAELLRDREPEALTVRDLAATAGVPTGTLYQFFADKDAVLQALALRFLAGMPEVLDAALPAGGGRWPDTVDRVVDAYATLVAAIPRSAPYGCRAPWTPPPGASSARRTRRSPRVSAPGCARSAGTRRGTPAQWRDAVALIDGLLRHAFADDPAGDPAALREARRAARAYAGAVLGAVAPHRGPEGLSAPGGVAPRRCPAPSVSATRGTPPPAPAPGTRRRRTSPAS